MIVPDNLKAAVVRAAFGAGEMASAAMDRLLHHSHVLVLEGKTFRNPPPDRRAPTSAPSADE